MLISVHVITKYQSLITLENHKKWCSENGSEKYDSSVDNKTVCGIRYQEMQLQMNLALNWQQRHAMAPNRAWREYDPFAAEFRDCAAIIGKEHASRRSAIAFNQIAGKNIAKPTAILQSL